MRRNCTEQEHAEHKHDGRGFERQLVEQDFHLLEHCADVALRIHLLVKSTHPINESSANTRHFLNGVIGVLEGKSNSEGRGGSGAPPRASHSACSTG